MLSIVHLVVITAVMTNVAYVGKINRSTATSIITRCHSSRTISNSISNSSNTCDWITCFDSSNAYQAKSGNIVNLI